MPENYVYATTSPVYETIAGKLRSSPEDAKYFVSWIERTIDITSKYPDWNSPADKEYVLKRLAEVKAVYKKLQ